MHSRKKKESSQDFCSYIFIFLFCVVFFSLLASSFFSFFSILRFLNLFSYYLIWKGSVIIRTRDVDTCLFMFLSLSLHCFNLLVFSLCVDWDVFILIIFPIGCPISLSVMCNTAPRACSLSYVYTCIYRICIYRIYIYIYNLFSTIFFFISTIYILGSRATRRENRYELMRRDNSHLENNNKIQRQSI